MPFAVGDTAVVRTFGNKRGEIIAISRDGRYQVRIDGISMWCHEPDLAVADPPKKQKAPARPRQASPDETAASPGRVDLHGLTVEDALGRMVDEIDRSLRRGADRVEVVHGKGSGRVMAAVHRQLAAMSVVAAFRLDPHNPGVTWAHFR